MGGTPHGRCADSAAQHAGALRLRPRGACAVGSCGPSPVRLVLGGWRTLVAGVGQLLDDGGIHCPHVPGAAGRVQRGAAVLSWAAHLAASGPSPQRQSRRRTRLAGGASRLRDRPPHCMKQAPARLRLACKPPLFQHPLSLCPNHNSIGSLVHLRLKRTPSPFQHPLSLVKH